MTSVPHRAQLATELSLVPRSPADRETPDLAGQTINPRHAGPTMSRRQSDRVFERA